MTHLRRRTFLALALAVPAAAASGAASADVVATPPPRISVRSEASTYSAPPTHLDLRVENPGAEPLALQGVRLVVQTAGIRVPVTIRGVERDGVRGGVWDVTSIAARGAIRLRLELGELSQTALRAGRLEFALRLGHAAEQTFTLTRA
jgi:hypothetical protein